VYFQCPDNHLELMSGQDEPEPEPEPEPAAPVLHVVMPVVLMDVDLSEQDIAF
jgi:hypothetical protein